MSQHVFRLGTYDTVEGANRAVDELLTAGFSKDRVTAICTDSTAASGMEPVRNRVREEPPRGTSAKSAAGGAALGAALGGLATVASAAVTGGVALLAAGGAAIWTGGAAGGLIGAMMARGVEKENADYYEQAVADGQILVGVEVDKNDAAAQEKADAILAKAGTEPVKVREG